MKEPFEIYHDEFFREIDRRAKPGESPGQRKIDQAELAEAEVIAAEAAAQHLVDVLGFRLAEAEAVMERLREVGPFQLDALKNAWTDVALRRNRQRHPR